MTEGLCVAEEEGMATQEGVCQSADTFPDVLCTVECGHMGTLPARHRGRKIWL